MIDFKCEKCGEPMQSPDSMINGQERCPNCSHINTVPDVVPDKLGTPPKLKVPWRFVVPGILGTAILVVTFVLIFSSDNSSELEEYKGIADICRKLSYRIETGHISCADIRMFNTEFVDQVAVSRGSNVDLGYAIKHIEISLNYIAEQWPLAIERKLLCQELIQESIELPEESFRELYQELSQAQRSLDAIPHKLSILRKQCDLFLKMWEDPGNSSEYAFQISELGLDL